MELLDIRFSFLCRSTYANEERKNPIVLRIVFRGERKDLFTGLYCAKENWDSSTGLVLKKDKAYKAINDNLKVILQRATHYKVKNISLNKVNGEFLNQYFLYLRRDKNISHNVVLRYFQFFKSVLLPAIKNGDIKQDPFLEVKHKREQKFVEYLNQEEIEKIAMAKLPGKDLERVRDIYLFACYTGLAYVDIKNLRSKDIILDTDNTLFIRKPRQKTGNESIIPLLPPALCVNYPFLFE